MLDLLGELSDSSMICFVLKTMEVNSVPFLHPFDKMSGKMVKVMVNWFHGILIASANVMTRNRLY